MSTQSDSVALFPLIRKIVFPALTIIALLLLPMSSVLTQGPMLQWILSSVINEEERVVGSSEFVNSEFYFYVSFPMPAIEQYHKSYIPSYGILATPAWHQNRLIFLSYMENTAIHVELLNASFYTTYQNEYGQTVHTTISKSDYNFMDFTLGYLGHRDLYLIDYNITSALFHVTASNPISIQHSTLGPNFYYETGEAAEHNVTHDSDDDVFSFYGTRLFAKIHGDLWIGSYTRTAVNITDLSDRDDSAYLPLGEFEGYAHLRNQDFEIFGFEDDYVLIEADDPVTIIAGYEDNDVFTQVFGKGGTQFFFPVFEYVTIVAPYGANIDLDDLEGSEGSVETYLAPGTSLTKAFKVHDYYFRFPDYQWCKLTADNPILVYTHRVDKRYLREGVYCTGGEDLLKSSKLSSPVLGASGGVLESSPLGTDFWVPINGRCYLTVCSLQNNTKIDASLSYKILGEAETHYATYQQNMTKYQIQTLTIDEKIKFDGNDTHDIVYSDFGNFSDVNMLVHIQSNHPIIVHQSYTYDNFDLRGSIYYYEIDSSLIDLIPGIALPAPLPPEDFPLFIELGAVALMAIEATLVITGSASTLSFLIPKRRRYNR
ncbi:MAG: hypothetical protein ACFFBD_02250 [Candidatus Hodarchaeota archaeon]